MPITSSVTSSFHSSRRITSDIYDKSSKKRLLPTNDSPLSPHNPDQEPSPTNKNKKPYGSLLSSRPDIDLSHHRIRNSQLGNLYSGSRFTGHQKCGDNRHKVVVDIQNVNLKQSSLCGYLHIKGLTSEYPELTTYFEGEIIGPKYSFLTRKWQAKQHVDLAHWKRFPSFHRHALYFNQGNFVYDPTNEDFVYMRWKEKFLVPDHHVDNVEGASFAGFYYVCFQRSTNTITGMYFYRHFTHWYQVLTLKYDSQRSFGSYEFR
ncbi:unnamed protein product [Absidia cylindrospora]